MPNIRVKSHDKKAPPAGKRPFQSVTPDDDRYGFWGMVTELHPENHTVHVRTPEGRIISNVRVPSSVWVTIDSDKGFLSGRRYMPPIDTLVLVFMPNGKYSSAVIIASGFSDDPQHENFKGDTEDEKEIDEFIKNSAWKYTEDNRTGTRVLQNKPDEPTIKLEIDQEKEGDEKVILTIHGNIFTVDKENGIKVETDKNIEFAIKKNATFKVDGDMSAEVKGKTEIKSTGNVKVESSANVDVKGVNVTAEASAMLTLKTGDAAPWMPNICPTCPFGFPHGGTPAGIVKLKGG